MGGALALGFTIGLMTAVVVYLAVMTLHSMRQGGRRGGRWRSYGLGLVLGTLFLVTWFFQGVSQWQQYTDEQAEHNQPTAAGDFAAIYASSTLENWQSEFLQLFSFVVLSAVLIHRGSAESKDSDDRMEQKLNKILKAVDGD